MEICFTGQVMSLKREDQTGMSAWNTGAEVSLTYDADEQIVIG